MNWSLEYYEDGQRHVCYKGVKILSSINEAIPFLMLMLGTRDLVSVYNGGKRGLSAKSSLRVSLMLDDSRVAIEAKTLEHSRISLICRVV